MSIFNKPVSRTIADVPVLVLQIPFESFDQAFVLGELFGGMDAGKYDFNDLRASLQPGDPRRQALVDLLQVCIQIPGDAGEPARPLGAADLAGMPIVAMAEAVIEVMEVNADFFFQTLPKLEKAAKRLTSIGSPLRSSSSGQGTASMTSAGTPSVSSPAT